MRRAIFVGLAMGIAACGAESGAESPKSAHDAGRGTARVYQATFDQAWSAAHSVIHDDAGGTPVDYQGEAGEAYVITKADSQSTAYDDTQIGVWVVPMANDEVRVSVVVIGPDSRDVGGPNEQQVQKDIGKAIAHMQAKAPPPEDKP
jgi:hypothetical protein